MKKTITLLLLIPLCLFLLLSGCSSFINGVKDGYSDAMSSTTPGTTVPVPSGADPSAETESNPTGGEDALSSESSSQSSTVAESTTRRSSAAQSKSSNPPVTKAPTKTFNEPSSTKAPTKPPETKAPTKPPETKAPTKATGKFIVYWGNTGDKVHISPNCRTIKNGVLSGTLAECKAAGHTEGWCGVCSKGWDDARFGKEGNPNA